MKLILLGFTTNDQDDKGFLLSTKVKGHQPLALRLIQRHPKFVIKGLFACGLKLISMYKIIKNSTKDQK